nr:unnamed protein product [Haemonchus contortus]
MGDVDDFQICDNVRASGLLEISPVWVEAAEDLNVVWVDVVTDDDKFTGEVAVSRSVAIFSISVARADDDEGPKAEEDETEGLTCLCVVEAVIGRGASDDVGMLDRSIIA